MAAGDFSASLLPDILVKLDELFLDPRTKRELTFPLDSAKAVLENQMVRFLPVMEGSKCTGVKAAWLKSCAEAVTDCDDPDLSNCAVTGPELESASQSFAPNGCLRTSFAVIDEECKDIYEFADKMAYGFAVKTMHLEKKLNQNVVSFLDAGATQNLYTGTYGTITAPKTTFLAAEWIPDLLAELDLTAMFNEINNPILLSGTLLRTAFYNAGFNQLNLDEKDQKAKFDAWNLIFDPRTVDSIVTEKALFMFDAGAAAFWSKNEFSNSAPMNMNDADNTHVFSMPSRTLKYKDGNVMKPVMYDVYTQRKCALDANAKRKWGTHVEIVLTYGLHTGPVGCDSGSGILQFGVTPVT